MKKQLWQKAIVGTILATSLAAPIALAQTTDSVNTTSGWQAQLVDHRGEGGKHWGHYRDSRHQGKRRHQSGDGSWGVQLKKTEFRISKCQDSACKLTSSIEYFVKLGLVV